MIKNGNVFFFIIHKVNSYFINIEIYKFKLLLCKKTTIIFPIKIHIEIVLNMHKLFYQNVVSLYIAFLNICEGVIIKQYTFKI